MNETDRGLLVVYTGDGKGKTTAAMGMLLRARGWGWKVGVVQFIKGKWKTGEAAFARANEITFLTLGEGFTWKSDDLEKDKVTARAAWQTATQMINSSDYDLLVLDELTYLISFGFVDESEILPILHNRPMTTNLVVTGRGASPALVAMADLVTEMTLIKHPFDKDHPARKGIDY